MLIKFPALVGATASSCAVPPLPPSPHALWTASGEFVKFATDAWAFYREDSLRDLDKLALVYKQERRDFSVEEYRRARFVKAGSRLPDDEWLQLVGQECKRRGLYLPTSLSA